MFGQRNAVRDVLLRHLGAPFDELATASRTYPVALRADLQLAIEDVLREYGSPRPMGVDIPFSTFGAPSMAKLAADGHLGATIVPLERQHVDVGENRPAECVRRGLWLARLGRTPFAVLLATNELLEKAIGIHVEVAARLASEHPDLAGTVMDEIDTRVARSRSYRGKVLSLDPVGEHGDGGGTVRVHRLETVPREHVVLPERTLQQLERNVHGFVRQRDRLKELGLGVKKGLLFYGAPGTGKTHTIRYLAGQLADHVTLLITGDQVTLLEEYFQLARFMQPTILVVEDADLIARDRGDSRSHVTETHLNKLLNEMDGLRPDTYLITILTTNRPETLEAALTARPGRIDQAIEFPLPDADARRRLVSLHSRRLELPEDVVSGIVNRTEGASPAFIKELLRRIAQYHLERQANVPVDAALVREALDEMVFVGGRLDRKLRRGPADA